MRKALCFVFCLTLTFASYAVGAQQDPAIPELPRLTIDNFSPVARDQIQEAYADARARPAGDVASGRLGMILQTYGLFQESAVCYRRARPLAPSSFRWAYYLGIVEAAEGHCDAAAAAIRLALRIYPDFFPGRLRYAACRLRFA